MQVEVLNWFRALLSAGRLVPFWGRSLCCPPEARTTSDLWSKCCCWKWDANTFATILKKSKIQHNLNQAALPAIWPLLPPSSLFFTSNVHKEQGRRWNFKEMTKIWFMFFNSQNCLEFYKKKHYQSRTQIRIWKVGLKTLNFKIIFLLRILWK